MAAELLPIHTSLSPQECQLRITTAASQGADRIVGYALSSQADIVDLGDGFEVRSKGGPGILIGTVAPGTTGSVIQARIEVPAQRFYRFAIGFVVVIAASLLGFTLYDLRFGTHYLLTSSRTELWGHPASVEEHFATLVLTPVVTIPIFAVLWPRARPLEREMVQTFREFVEILFDAKQSMKEPKEQG